ncbi:hypothetical protein Tco_0742779 [Tanacetum coccineum]
MGGVNRMSMVRVIDDRKHDRQGSDRQGGGGNYHNNNNNNYSRDNNRNSGAGRDQGTCGQQTHDLTQLEGTSFEITSLFSLCLVIIFSGDCKEELSDSSSGLADKKPEHQCHAHRAIRFDVIPVVFYSADIHAPEFSLSWFITGKPMKIISALKARTLLSMAVKVFWTTINDTTSDVSFIHDQPIVSEFQDVFPEELLGIPPIRDVEFNIELIPGAEPISKAPYRMAPIELKELKDQLQDVGKYKSKGQSIAKQKVKVLLS